MSTRKVSPRKAALLAAAVLATSTLSTPALAAVQSMSSVTTAAAAGTIVSRISVPSGALAGGNTVLISGKDLATGSGSLTAKAVKFGSTTVPTGDVTAVSASALEVEVPAASASGPVNVVVGDAKKGVVYKYVGSDVTVTTTQSNLNALAPTTDAGLPGVEINGTNFDAGTKVLVGGKPATATVTATKLTVAMPAGLSGIQDVVVSDPRNSVYVGYVTYALAQPTLTAVSSYAANEAATVVYLTGTNLNAVTSATFDTTEKVGVTKTTDPTKLAVTIPKGSAKTATLKVLTKNNKNATFSVERKASGTPTVTGVTGAIAAGGNVTVAGTNLVGLKSVTLSKTGAKSVKGKVVKVDSGTSATVTLPALVAGSWDIVVGTNASTASTAASFTVASGAPTVTAGSLNGAKTALSLTGTQLKTASKVTITPGSGSPIEVTGSNLVPNTAGTSLVATVSPALSAGTYGVTVTNPAGTSTSFSVTAVATPTVSAVTAASNKTDITVTGTALTGATKVKITPGSGSPIEQTSGLTVNGAGTELTFSLGSALADGTYGVVVTTPGGDSVSATLTVS